MDLEKLLEEIMELRQDINQLADILLKKKQVSLATPAFTVDLTIITNARDTVRRLTKVEGGLTE